MERFRTYLSPGGGNEGLGRALGAFDAFFATASAGLALLDDELRYLRVNQALAAINGKPVGEHLGRTFAEVLPDAAAWIEPKLKEVLRTGIPVEKVPFEMRGRSFIGTFFPVYSDSQALSGLGGIIIDVTEHKRLESDLRAAIEIRERVLAVVSHDLRNPLGTIQLAISTLPTSCLADKDVARRVEIVARAAKTMENLIGDLLDIATIQAGKLALDVDFEHAELLVKEAVDQYAPLAEGKGVELVDSSRFGDTVVVCDRGRILQVLGNLCGNAIKFCRRGDRISIGGHVHDGMIVLEVADSGPGIPDADIPHLFEPYWSTVRSRERGTGLGLFICKAIADAHGGVMSVESVIGAGTTFRLYLPVG